MLLGADHASHQGDIDMAQLKREGHTFEIGKATGEGDYTNPFYRPNHERAKAAGLITGSYDWVEPQDGRAGAWLAEDYLRVVGERPPGHLLTVDFETPDWYTGPRGRNIEAFMKEYLYTLKEKSGQPIGVYTAPYFLQETGAIDWAWLGRDFWYWMAAPGNATGTGDQLADDIPWQRPLGPPWDRVAIHQHQWYARSGAIGSGANFDRNRYNGTREQLMALGNGSGLGAAAAKREVGIVHEPPAGKTTYYVNGRGEPIFVWNAGGETPGIVGVNIQDLGMSVLSKTEPGRILDVSIKNNEALPYRARR